MEECIICLETLQQNIVTLSCNHKFHYECINEWSSKNNRNINFPLCPLCRSKEEIINIENFKIKKNKYKKLKCCCNII